MSQQQKHENENIKEQHRHTRINACSFLLKQHQSEQIVCNPKSYHDMSRLYRGANLLDQSRSSVQLLRDEQALNLSGSEEQSLDLGQVAITGRPHSPPWLLPGGDVHGSGVQALVTNPILIPQGLLRVLLTCMFCIRRPQEEVTCRDLCEQP